MRRTTLHKKRSKTITKSCKNPSKFVVGGLQNAPPKNDHKQSQQKSQKKCRKSTIWGTPNFGGRTGVERTFRHFFGFGRLWGAFGAAPGRRMVPRQPPSPPRTPPNLDVCRFLIDFQTFFDRFMEFVRLIFSCIFACVWVVVWNAPHNTERRTQNAAGTVAGMARRAVG